MNRLTWTYKYHIHPIPSMSCVNENMFLLVGERIPNCISDIARDPTTEPKMLRHIDMTRKTLLTFFSWRPNALQPTSKKSSSATTDHNWPSLNSFHFLPILPAFHEFHRLSPTPLELPFWTPSRHCARCHCDCRGFGCRPNTPVPARWRGRLLATSLWKSNNKPQRRTHDLLYQYLAQTIVNPNNKSNTTHGAPIHQLRWICMCS